MIQKIKCFFGLHETYLKRIHAKTYWVKCRHCNNLLDIYTYRNVVDMRK